MTRSFDLDLRTRARFLYNVYLTAKFDRPTFSSSEVIVRTNTLTNRRRWKHPPRSATPRRWVINESRPALNCVLLLLLLLSFSSDAISLHAVGAMNGTERTSHPDAINRVHARCSLFNPDAAFHPTTQHNNHGNSRIRQLADWTTRGVADAAKKENWARKVADGIRELSSYHNHNTTILKIHVVVSSSELTTSGGRWHARQSRKLYGKLLYTRQTVNV